MRCFPRDEPCYWLRLTKGPQIGYVIRIPLRIAKRLLLFPDKNEFVIYLKSFFELQNAPATFSAQDYVNLENYFVTPYQYLFPDDPTQPLPIPSYTPVSVGHAKTSDTEIEEAVNMDYPVMYYRSRVYEFRVDYDNGGTKSYYDIQVFWDWVTNQWSGWKDSVLTVTNLGTDGLYSIRFTVTTTEAGATFDDLDPHVTVYPPFSFLPVQYFHVLFATDDYRAEVELAYEWQMFLDRQYTIQASWTEPIVGTTTGQVATGTVTAIVKYDYPGANWTVDTGDVLFPAEIRANNNAKIIDVRITRGGTVPNGFTFVDADPIAWAEQLMA
jgi:hypothetical protein